MLKLNITHNSFYITKLMLNIFLRKKLHPDKYFDFSRNSKHEGKNLLYS